MNYIERKVRSAPGLSQEQALESLQSHPNYRAGSRIASLRRRGDRWVATLHVPKTAGGFPPSAGGGDEGPPKPPKGEEAPDDDDGAEDMGGPPPGMDGPPDGDDHMGGDEKPKPDEEILHVLTEILHALKGGPAGPGMGGPDDMGPPPGPMGGPPPPHGGPPGGAPPGGPPPPPPGLAKPKPGMPPPGVGGPAFSSTHPLYTRIAKVAGRQRHIPVSSPVGMTVAEARSELAPIAAHFGYHVAQVRYCGPSCRCQSAGSNKIHALLEAS